MSLRLERLPTGVALPSEFAGLHAGMGYAQKDEPLWPGAEALLAWEGGILRGRLSLSLAPGLKGLERSAGLLGHYEALDPEAVSMAGGEATPEEEQITEQELQDLEEEAIATMSKGYFRQVGDIRFESAADDSVYVYDLMTHFLDAFSSKKKQQPDWVRPKISIMAVKYGLRPVRDFNYQIHYLGDHKLKAGESYAPANYYADLVTVYSSENEAEEPLEDDLSTGAN